MHLVDQEERASAGGPGDLADLAHKIGEVLLGIAGVGDPGGGFHIELQLHAGGHGNAERLHHAECAVDALLDAVLSAHLAQQPRRHPRERHSEVRLGSDLLDVGGRPARLGGEHVELHQQDRLAHAAQAGVDQAALIAAAGQPLGQRLEVLEVAVATGERRGLSSGAWRVGVLPLLHGDVF